MDCLSKHCIWNVCDLDRGSHMSVHVSLLNSLKQLRKRGKMRGLPCMLYFFRNKFNKFNNAGARMLDSYHMTSKLLKIAFWPEHVNILPSFM